MAQLANKISFLIITFLLKIGNIPVQKNRFPVIDVVVIEINAEVFTGRKQNQWLLDKMKNKDSSLHQQYKTKYN